MKQFFSIVFGGMSAIAVGIGASYLGLSGWRAISPHLTGLDWSRVAALADAVMSQPTDGTAISGMTRTVRWTASQEEDSVDATTMALTNSTSETVTARTYIVKDLSRTEDAPLASDASRLMPIASLTKLVTAAVAVQLIPPSTHIALTRNIMATYGNTADFKAGETFAAGDLMYPLLMVSSNDAAEALAQSYGRTKFIAAMNDFVRSIGAYRTYFVDPSGLSPQNVSTASDLAIILDWLRTNAPDVLSITRLKSKTVRDRTFVNPTHFLSWSNYAGGKNGYTPEANRTGASLFTAGKNKDLYAVVVLGSSSRDSDEFNLLRIATK